MPRGSQNRSQNGTKSIIFFHIEKVPLEDLLGAVLERSWSVFGAIWGGKNLEKPLVFLCFFKICFFTKKASQEPSWTELGANFGAQEAQMGAQEAPKTGPKNDQKNVQNKI